MPSRSAPRDAIDRALLVEIERRFPLDHRPFHFLALPLSISEQECLERVNRLKRDRFIESISVSFMREAFGYRHQLVAMKVDSRRVDHAVECVRGHPGVEGVAQRYDSFNLWFSIALPQAEDLKRVLHILHRQTKAQETLLLSSLKVYKTQERSSASSGQLPLDFRDTMDVKTPIQMLAMGSSGSKRRQFMADTSVVPKTHVRQGTRHSHPGLMAKTPPQQVLTQAAPERGANSLPFDPQYLSLIRVVQEDLPLLEMPYTVWAQQAETTEEALFSWIKQLDRQGVIYSFAAIPPLPPVSGKSGVQSLIVWEVPEEEVDKIGEDIAHIREVHYCARRARYAHWPYTLFTLIHTKTESMGVDVVRQIENQVGHLTHKRLVDTQVYPPMRVKYFSAKLDEWWREVSSFSDQ